MAASTGLFRPQGRERAVGPESAVGRHPRPKPAAFRGGNEERLGYDLEALKDDRKGRFNLLLGLAGFERAVGRTAAARARLQPAAGPRGAAAVARAAQAGARSARHDRARRAGPRARGLARARARDGAAAGGGGGALRGGRARRRRDPRSGDRRQPGAVERRGLARARAAARRARRRAGARSRRRGAAPGAHARAGLVRSARAARPDRPPPRRRQRARPARAPPRRSTRAPSISRPRSGSTSAIRSAWGAIWSRRRWPTRPASSPPRCRSTRSAARCRRRRSTRSRTTARGCGRWPTASASWARSKDGRREGGPPAADSDALVGPWIDRAVALDVQEARFARAAARAAAGDRAGALGRSRRLRRARAEPRAPGRGARAARGAGRRADPSERRRTTTRTSRRGCWRASACSRIGRTRRCARSAGAARGSCRPAAWWRSGWSTNTPIGEPPRAAATSWRGAAGDHGALARLARLDARLPDAELRAADRRLLEQAASARHRRGRWALARLSRGGPGDRCRRWLGPRRRALALAAKSPAAADVWIPAAEAAERALSEACRADEETRRERRRRTELAAVALALLAVALLVRRRWGGRTVAAALRGAPPSSPRWRARSPSCATTSSSTAPG